MSLRPVFFRRRGFVFAVSALLALPAAHVAVAQTTQEQAPAAAAETVDPETVVATANGIEITEADIAIAREDPALSLPNVSDEQRRSMIIQYLVDLKLGAKAAAETSIAESDDFARRLQYFRDKLLLDAWLEERVASAVTEEAARALYDETVKGTEPAEEVRARHILVPEKEAAEAAAARIAAGEDFAAVAEELSQDPGSRGRGGDLGFFTKERMVAPFAEKAFELEPGQVSEPVETQFGWHVIKVEERRERPIPAFEEMREQIDNFLARRAQQELILSLRESAEIERLDQPAAGTEAAPQAGEAGAEGGKAQ